MRVLESAPSEVRMKTEMYKTKQQESIAQTKLKINTKKRSPSDDYLYPTPLNSLDGDGIQR